MPMLHHCLISTDKKIMLTLLRSKFKKAETDTQRNMHSYALSMRRRITYQKQAGYAYAKQLVGTPRLKKSGYAHESMRQVSVGRDCRENSHGYATGLSAKN